VPIPQTNVTQHDKAVADSVANSLGNVIAQRKLLPRAEYARYMYYCARIAEVDGDFVTVLHAQLPGGWLQGS